jgi:hypothetical protein
VDWLNREQRVEEWEEELEEINEQLNQSMAMDTATGEEKEAVFGDAGDGSQRQIDIEIKELKEERDTLKRRVDMERSGSRPCAGNRPRRCSQLPLRRMGLSEPNLFARLVPCF